MNFIRHSDLEGMHAFLGASNYHWINKNKEDFEIFYRSHIAALRGTEWHELAKQLIDKRQKLPDTKNTFNMYVNDAIHLHMNTEVTLLYSRNCFGTADTISFRDGFLRIHDLKTGLHDACMKQLMIYASLFCLEYKKDPNKIKIELRIYQKDRVLVHEPNPAKINEIMGKIILFDKTINKINEEENYDE